jgi:hypothetical protein
MTRRSKPKPAENLPAGPLPFQAIEESLLRKAFQFPNGLIDLAFCVNHLWWWRRLDQILPSLMSPKPRFEAVSISYLVPGKRQRGFPPHVFEMIDQHFQNRRLADMVRIWRIREISARIGQPKLWPAYLEPFFPPDESAKFVRDLGAVDLRDSKGAIKKRMLEKIDEFFDESGLSDRARNGGRANRHRYFNTESFRIIETIDKKFLLRMPVDENELNRLRAAVHALRKSQS